MRIQLSLPNDVYWEAKQKAAASHMELEEYIAQLVAEEVNTDLTSTPDEEFKRFIISWFDDLEEGTQQAANVIAVIKKMRDGYEYAEAVAERGEEYRRTNPTVGDNYEKTVRTSCTRELGFTGKGATQRFIQEVKSLIKSYEE